MNNTHRDPTRPPGRRARRAISELKTLIRRKYPNALFTVSHGEDPEGIYLHAVVDVADIDEVIGVFGDRLLEMQVEEGLPVYVIPLEAVPA
jgi:hypothetical protein